MEENSNYAHKIHYYVGTASSDSMVVQHNLGLGTDYKPIVQLISNTHALMLYQVSNITTNSFKINVVCIDGYKMAMYNGEVKLVWTY